MKRLPLLLLVLLLACSSSSSDPGSGGSGGGGEPTERRVFVTESLQAADLGGFEGADAICAAEAADAGLEGEFKAWLSIAGMPAAGRLAQSSVPYVLVDGTRIADDWSDLVDGDIQAPIDLDAAGQPQDRDVWTGTLADGETFPGGDCEGFTSASSSILSLCGSTAFANSQWTNAQTPACSTGLRLYCFEQ